MKKAAALTTKVVIAKVQRQKRKYVTVVTGLETIPDLKIKDAAKLFGKKFSSGASVGDTPTGGKEITIQGDVSFDLPPLLMNEYKVSYCDSYLGTLFDIPRIDCTQHYLFLGGWKAYSFRLILVFCSD